jgi:hypothetical protein
MVASQYRRDGAELHPDDESGQSDVRRRSLMLMLGAFIVAVMIGRDAERAFAPVYCCGPSNGCSCCDGRWCCAKNCTTRWGECPQPPSNQSCWTCCAGSTLLNCCDYFEGDNNVKCICPEVVGSC